MDATTSGASAEATEFEYTITRQELDGLQQLASVARCCQTHALSPEVQLALQWIETAERDQYGPLPTTATIGEAAYICRIEDPASGSAVAFGANEDEARERAVARFHEDFGCDPSSQSGISVYAR